MKFSLHPRRPLLSLVSGSSGRTTSACWFIFLINPLASYLSELGRGGHASLARDLGAGQGAGPMWFVAALLAFSLAYAMLRQVHAPPVARRLSGVQVMVAAAILIAVTAFLTWRWWRPDDASTLWHLQWESWPQGAGPVCPRGVGG